MTTEDLQRLADLKACTQRHTWREISDFTGLSWNQARNRWRRHARDLTPTPGPCPLCISGGPAGGEGATWEERGNYAQASGEGSQIDSLDALLAAVDPDLDVWQILDWGVKTWPLGAKEKTGSLTWDDGKIVNGHLDYRGLRRLPLWSVWAKFIRRKPIPIQPVVSPVACDVSFPFPDPQVPEGDVSRCLIVPDIHLGYARGPAWGELIPFHDRRALALVLQLARALSVSHIAIIGDFQDLTMFTDRFIRSPEYYFTTQPAIIEGHYWLKALREAAPGAPIWLLEGNHDRRLTDSLRVHGLEVYGLKAADELHLPPALSLARLLNLHDLGIQWVEGYPDAEVILGPVVLRHGDRVSGVPGGSARAMAEAGDHDVVFGHTHRIERVSRRVRCRNGWRTVRAASVGCLCHTDGRVPGSKQGANWQQGLGLLEWTEGEELYNLNIIEIEKGAAYYGGLWTGSDYRATLAANWPRFAW